MKPTLKFLAVHGQFAPASVYDHARGSRLAAHGSTLAGVFGVDADGVTAVHHRVEGKTSQIQDRVSRTAVYVATTNTRERERIDKRLQALITLETSVPFDPGNSGADLGVLKQLLESRAK